MNTVLGNEDQPELSLKVFGSKISLYEEHGGMTTMLCRVLSDVL